ncbi:hypothetical protein AQUCO_01400817v1 [Aquilegia coerulea]|uniref:F-box associated beta-propeller type 3 domain-containing protein n=1 Tax=Aquilegia coerulea TaxID=218851 RepID=A0A2G5DYE9_AQUCA|nr:hypothetical protein AQUCO_01400817v1 [Aquilegia coerulea]
MPCGMFLVGWEEGAERDSVIRGFFVQNTTVDLPYEIIADILSRLPAECVFHSVNACKPLTALTTTSSFVNLHQSRATPVIAFHYYLRRDYHDLKNSAQNVNIYFTDANTKKIVTKSVKIDLGHACHNRPCSAFLYGSCDGFLLFGNLMFESVLFIWSPITEEQATVIAPHTGYRIRGFFFHAAAKEYRALFVSLKGQGFDFEYFVLSLRTKSTRQISSYSYPPCSFRNPVFLNDVLHWMVDDKSYKRANGVHPHCSNAILLFNVYSEEFSTVPHPGGQCCLRGDHFPITLMENEGLLCLCDATSHEELVVWILEDYKNKVWVKRDLFLFNMTHGTFRRVGKKCRDRYLGVSPVCHVNTLATLGTDKVVKLFVEEEAI